MHFQNFTPKKYLSYFDALHWAQVWLTFPDQSYGYWLKHMHYAVMQHVGYVSYKKRWSFQIIRVDKRVAWIRIFVLSSISIAGNFLPNAALQQQPNLWVSTPKIQKLSASIQRVIILQVYGVEGYDMRDGVKGTWSSWLRSNGSVLYIISNYPYYEHLEECVL